MMLRSSPCSAVWSREETKRSFDSPRGSCAAKPDSPASPGRNLRQAPLFPADAARQRFKTAGRKDYFKTYLNDDARSVWLSNVRFLRTGHFAFHSSMCPDPNIASENFRWMFTEQSCWRRWKRHSFRFGTIRFETVRRDWLMFFEKVTLLIHI